MASGLTVTVPPGKEPGIQVYVVAPLPKRLELPPTQIEVGVAEALTRGIGFTATVIVRVEIQPKALAPITV